MTSPATLLKETGERSATRQSPVAALQRLMIVLPSLVRSVGDGARVDGRPHAGSPTMGVGPSKDLGGCEAHEMAPSTVGCIASVTRHRSIVHGPDGAM